MNGTIKVLIIALCVLIYVAGVGANWRYTSKHWYWNMNPLTSPSQNMIGGLVNLTSWLFFGVMWFLDNKTTVMDRDKHRMHLFEAFKLEHGRYPSAHGPDPAWLRFEQDSKRTHC